MSKSEFGVVTDLYVWVAVLIVLLTYGMETAFFFHAGKGESDRVFRTGMLSLLLTTLLFYAFFEWQLESISLWMRYTDHPEYLRYMAWILCLDVLAALPFARLRLEGRAVRFVFVKMSLIAVNIATNLFFFLYVVPSQEDLQLWGLSLTLPHVEYVLLANLFASSVMFILLFPQWRSVFRWGDWDKPLWRRMLVYGLPLMVAGLAGIANELADRQFLKYLLPQELAMAEVGVYGAIYKLSIFLVLFVQAYRYAAEPFFFRMQVADQREMNARVLRYYTLMLGAVVIALNAGIPVIKHFIDEKFWTGLYIAPVLFAANFILGLNTHLGIWYKLADRTSFALLITFAGLLVTIALNFWLIPHMGILGSAWATLASYTCMAVLNAFLGRKYAPMPYAWKVLLSYFFSSLLLGFFAWRVQADWGLWSVLCILPYGLLAVILERESWVKWRMSRS